MAMTPNQRRKFAHGSNALVTAKVAMNWIHLMTGRGCTFFLTVVAPGSSQDHLLS